MTPYRLLAPPPGFCAVVNNVDGITNRRRWKALLQKAVNGDKEGKPPKPIAAFAPPGGAIGELWGVMRMLSSPLEKARSFHDQAEAVEALARMEQNRHRQKIMAAISELLFLLHDKFVELGEPAPLGDVIKFKR